MLTPEARHTLATRIEIAQALSDRAAGLGYLSYLNQLTIASRPEARPFKEVADPWQWDDAKKFAPRLDYMAGISPLPRATPQHYWRTRPRGHDKTGQIGRTINFLLAYSRRPLNCVIAACDGEQATILLDSMKEEAGLNPWLGSKLTYHATRASGPGGSLRVLKADAPSAYGQRADIIIYEEVTWWKKQDLFTALHSGKEKSGKGQGCEIVICNAGALGSWQYNWLKDCQADKTWSVEEVPVGQHLASWMDGDAIRKERAKYPPGIAARLIDNRWVSPSEAFGFLSEDDLNAALNRDIAHDIRATRYFLGIDYGPRRDRTALSVLHREGTGDVLLIDELEVWQGSPDEPVQVERVERWINDRFARYPDLALCFDRYQMEATIQKYQREGRIVNVWEPRGGKGNYEMAENLRSLIVNRRLQWRPDAGLLAIPGGTVEDFRQELLQLVMKVQPYGYRFDHEAGHHDDRACSVGMAALFAVRDPNAVPWIAPRAMTNPRPVQDHRIVLGGRPGGGLLERARGDYRGLYGTPTSPGRDGSRVVWEPF